MGGEHSGIGDATTKVLLEGAFWNPAVIQGRSRRLGFASDAGFRFERGVDFGNCARAVERATQLILDICGGRAGPLGDVTGVLPRREAVRVRPARVKRLLGIEVPDDTMGTLFARLGLAFTRNGNDFIVTPPTSRFDLVIEEDFVEEIARLVGYDAIPAKPSAHAQRMLPDPETALSSLALKRRLAARDWQEAITYSFVSSAAEANLFPDRPSAAAPIAVQNPIATHLDVMRTTLAGGLLDVLRTNLARQHDRVRVFEVGCCFLRDGNGDLQPLRIGGVAYGPALPEQWGIAKRPVDFHDVKGDLEALVAPRTLVTDVSSHPLFHPGRSARVVLDGESIGWLGELHPRLAKAYELPRAPIIFELDMAPLLAQPMPAARPLSKLPVVRRDFAVVVDDSVPVGALLDALGAAKPARVVAMRPFDLYRGSGLPPGKKSVAILVLMQDTERTLTDADIDATLADLLRVLQVRFGAVLR
jgi:phenylalanyl-tRNA synthetase beta chain